SDREEVGPAVVVEVGELGPPADERLADRARAAGGAGVLEERPLDVAVEAVGLAAEVRDEDRGPALSEWVSDRDAHAGAGPLAEDAGAGLGRRLLEGPVPGVSEETVADPVIGEKEVGAAVAVVIQGRDAEGLGLSRVHLEPRGLRRVREMPVPLVSKEVGLLAGVVLGHAQLELGLPGLPLW